ncbi:hypothetical protein SAMN05421664_1232 [Chryseobacterium soldanellicola]|uniref:Uncharacterized protein n=1 Tax=Chryseobacterium soldanellicola TaxID=311333 RepID=A0A1H1A3M2_9FLAO|nr:hypothetical protein [Chryseobacterium soldanellicola]SDQ34257.1 hypothetical protein SAMN05421664_1232 [Chryseobacterium soldanellicola]
MEKKLLFIFFLLISIRGFKSQTLTFEYEDGGNQVIRQYCAICLSYNKTALKDGLTTKEEFPPQIYQVKIYPNPTKDKANLIWSPELGDMIQKVEYVKTVSSYMRENTEKFWR